MSANGRAKGIFDFLTDPLWNSGKIYLLIFSAISLTGLPQFIIAFYGAFVQLTGRSGKLDIFVNLPSYFAFAVTAATAFVILLMIYVADFEEVKAKKPEKENEKFGKTYLAALVIGSAITSLIVGGLLTFFGGYIADEPLTMPSAALLCIVASFVFVIFLDAVILHKTADGVAKRLLRKLKAAGLLNLNNVITILRDIVKGNPAAVLTDIIKDLRNAGTIPKDMTDETIIAKAKEGL